MSKSGAKKFIAQIHIDSKYNLCAKDDYPNITLEICLIKRKKGKLEYYTAHPIKLRQIHEITIKRK